MNNLPLALNSEVVVQELKGELLIYDLSRNEAFCLNETSKIVYQACDGKQTFDELITKHQFTDDLIYLALEQLQAKNLLENQNTDYFKRLTRREVIKRAGLASVIALPLITGITAPLAAGAASANNTCPSNVCFAPGSAICTGCTGLITFTAYSSTDGSCSGTIVSTSDYNCGFPGTNAMDLLRS